MMGRRWYLSLPLCTSESPNWFVWFVVYLSLLCSSYLLRPTFSLLHTLNNVPENICSVREKKRKSRPRLPSISAFPPYVILRYSVCELRRGNVTSCLQESTEASRWSCGGSSHLCEQQSVTGCITRNPHAHCKHNMNMLICALRDVCTSSLSPLGFVVSACSVVNCNIHPVYSCMEEYLWTWWTLMMHSNSSFWIQF